MSFARGAQLSSQAKGALISELPVVCFMSIEGSPHKSNGILDHFASYIEQKEEELYMNAQAKTENLNSKVHRLQFARLDIQRNHKVKSLILSNVRVVNPKVIVYVSYLEVVKVLNNERLVIRGH